MTSERALTVAILVSISLTGCATGDGNGAGGSTTTDSVCPAGTIVCEGSIAKTCDGKGGFSSQSDCDPQACADDLGCVACAPEAGSCDGGVGKACGPDGRFFTFECDPIQGMECAPDGCKGPCSPATLGQSYLGCEYWPTVTMNGVFEDAFSFAVALGSTSADTTAVTIEGPDFSFQTSLLAYEVKTLSLPWVLSLKGGSFPI